MALRPRDAAKALGVSPRTLWQWTKDKRIPHVQVGTGRRQLTLYPADALRHWLAGQANLGTVSREGGAE